MSEKTIDSEVLAALHFMDKKLHEGISHLDSVRFEIINGCTELLEKGYAIRTVDDGKTYYRLTLSGQEYLNKILELAS